MRPILFVDDQHVVAQSIAHILDMSGFKVQIASSVAYALSRLNDGRPGALITDWHLPDGTGADVISLCRNRYSHVPAVVQTASPNSVNVSGIRVIEKPYPVDTLLNWLNTSLPGA